MRIRNIIICLTFISFFTFTIQSCIKESETAKKDDVIELRADPNKRTLYRACWSEWGRTSKECESWGLCNFEDCWGWQDPCCEDSSAGGGEIIYSQNGLGTLIITLNSGNSTDLNAIVNQLPLFVDSDLIRATSNPSYTTITVLNGVYNFQSQIGESGGYEVNIQLN